MFTPFYTEKLVPNCASEASALWSCGNIRWQYVRDSGFFRDWENWVGWERPSRMSLVFAFSEFFENLQRRVRANASLRAFRSLCRREIRASEASSVGLVWGHQVTVCESFRDFWEIGKTGGSWDGTLWISLVCILQSRSEWKKSE